MAEPHKTTHVDHSQADSFYIVAYDEKGHHRGWARIFYLGGERLRTESDKSPTWWCYVSVVSDWGNFGHIWSHCGCEPVRFLAGLNMGYAMGKLMGARELEEYDGHATYVGIVRQVLQRRRKRLASSESTWNVHYALQDYRGEIEASKDSMVNAMLRLRSDYRSDLDDLGLLDEFDEPWYLAKERDNPQATSFWKWCWPPFIAALKARQAQQTQHEETHL